MKVTKINLKKIKEYIKCLFSFFNKKYLKGRDFLKSIKEIPLFIKKGVSFIKKILLKSFEAIAVIIVMYLIISIGYKMLFGIGVDRFTDRQIEGIIQKNIKGESFKYTYIDFNTNSKKDSIAVITTGNFISGEFNNIEELDFPTLYIFERVIKNPLEEIIFKNNFYDLREEILLQPVYDVSQGFTPYDGINYTYIKAIDLFNDGSQELFFCLTGWGGSGFPTFCSIYDGKSFITPFPSIFSFTYNFNEDNNAVSQRTRHYYYGELVDQPLASKKPIYSQISSSDYYYFDDKNDDMYFLKIIGEESYEISRADSHNYMVYRYNILKPFRELNEVPSFFVHGLNNKYKSLENDKGKPYDIIFKIIKNIGNEK